VLLPIVEAILDRSQGKMAASSEISMSFCNDSAARLSSKAAMDIEDKATEKAFLCSWVY
jgi:hypothetical protein